MTQIYRVALLMGQDLGFNREVLRGIELMPLIRSTGYSAMGCQNPVLWPRCGDGGPTASSRTCSCRELHVPC